MAVVRRFHMVSMGLRSGEEAGHGIFVLGEEEAVALLCSVGSSVSWCPVLHEEYWASDLMRLLQPEGEESRIENVVAVCLCPNRTPALLVPNHNL